MFAFRSEITGLVKKDPTATDSERRRVLAAIAGVDDDLAKVSFADAAERLGFKKTTVYRLVKKGELVGVKGTGKRPCGVTKSSLDSYLERRRVSAQ